MPTFLDDLPGIRDLQQGDDASLPRRNKLALFGDVTAVDNPVTGTTDLTFTSAPTAGHINVTLASNTTITGAGIDEANVVRLSTVADRSVYGLDAATMPRVVLANVSAQMLTIMHESGSAAAAARILCPAASAYALAAGDAVELVRDTVSDRWRLVR